MHWQRGDLEAAREAYGRIEAVAQAAPHVRRTSVYPLWDAFQLLIEGQLEAAEALLDEFVQVPERVYFSRNFGDARLLLAYVRLQQGDAAAALDTLRPVLAECEAEGTPGLIMWQGQMIVPLLRLATTHGVHAQFAAQVLALMGVPLEQPVPAVPTTGGPPCCARTPPARQRRGAHRARGRGAAAAGSGRQQSRDRRAPDHQPAHRQTPCR